MYITENVCLRVSRLWRTIREARGRGGGKGDTSTHNIAFEENLISNDIKELEPEFLWNLRSQFLCVSLTQNKKFVPKRAPAHSRTHKCTHTNAIEMLIKKVIEQNSVIKNEIKNKKVKTNNGNKSTKMKQNRKSIKINQPAFTGEFIWADYRTKLLLILLLHPKKKNIEKIARFSVDCRLPYSFYPAARRKVYKAPVSYCHK